MNNFLLAQDAINGKEGCAVVQNEGKNSVLFGLKKINTDAEFQESDFKVVGTRLVQTKTSGVKMSGTATIYYGTPVFLDMLVQYLKTGKVPVFVIQITNDDPATTVGQQTVVLYGVKLSKVPIAILDADSDELEEEISFTFTNIEVLNAFNEQPAQLGGN